MNKDNREKNSARVDAREKVRGRTRFIDDIPFHGLLEGATVRSPVSCGRINRIENLDEIKNMPGVRAVLTASDIPGDNCIPFVKDDYPCLASDRVKFHGQAIALIAARSRHQAREAARAAKISIEEHPAVYDPIEAMTPDSPYVGGEDNILSSFRIRKGNIKKGFKQADVIVDRTYTTAHQVHCYLENQGITAVPEPSSVMRVMGSMQCPFYVHNALVRVLGIPYSKVRVLQAATGGGFGGKEDMPSLVAAHAALLARKTGRPVRIVYDRREDFISMSKRHPSRTRIKYGASREGKILACEAEYIVNGGAYTTLSPIVAWRGLVHVSGPYRIPHVSVDAYAMATNTVPCGALRGFGQPQVNFANESLIDELAEKLDMDPAQLRRKNILKTGSLTATAQQVGESCGMEETLEKALDKSKFTPRKGKDEGTIKKGMGISTTFYGVGLGAEGKYFAKAGAQVYVKEDGSIFIAVGNVEMGQGALTVFNRICARTLGCPYDMVEVMQVDTTRVPDSGPTVASRATMVGGRAVEDAALQIRDVLKKAAAAKLGVKASRIQVEEGKYRSKEGEIDYKDAVNEAYLRRDRVAAQGWYTVKDVSFDFETGRGKAYPVYTFSTNIARVQVDTQTGEVEVTDFVAAHDIGKAIHFPSAEGQIQGGTVQAIGYALYENLVLEKGKILNPSFTGYTIPTSMDIPDVEPIIVESSYAEGPFGAKGLGEPPMVGPAAAVLNAIYDACGVRIRKIPCLPEDVLGALNKSPAGQNIL